MFFEKIFNIFDFFHQSRISNYLKKLNTEYFIDVGAHKGEFLSYILNLKYKKIYCFEPQKNVFKILKKNFKPYYEKDISSAIKFGFLANNTFNTYLRNIGSSEWDIAAGHAILLGIGGDIIDLNTKKTISYSKKNYRNSRFIAVNNLENKILKSLL